MAVETGPNFGAGAGGGGTPDNTQYDYRDDEVGAYPFEEYGITSETKEEMAARWETKHKAVFIGVVILTLLAVK